MTNATLAAGAAIWRPAADASQRPQGPQGAAAAEVLVVHRPKYDDWSLPKGKSEPGEHILLTAVREVWEETSVRPVLGPRLPTVEYISWGRPKRVSYWSAFGAGLEAAPGNEIDAVSWLPLAQAREQLRLGRAQGGLARSGRVAAARRARGGRRAGAGRPARLLRARRAGDQLARAALHRDRASVRCDVRGDRRG